MKSIDIPKIDSINRSYNVDYHDDHDPCQSDAEAMLHELLMSKIFLGVLYSVVLLTAVCGNFLVVYVVVTNRAMQTVTNLFITNLAVSDFVVNLTSLWVTPLYTYLGQWIWGAALCHFVPLFQGTSIFISSLTLTAIAVDRYIVILYPFKKRTSLAVCLSVISFIWLLSLMLVAPYAVHMTIIDYPICAGKTLAICRENWAMEQFQTVYGIIVMTLQFGVPFVVITFCYCRIWFYLKYRESTLGPRSDADLRRKRRMLKMLVSMVVIFALCWLPPNVVNIIKDNRRIAESYTFVFMFLLAHVISMTSSMWNPLLYAFLNDNFRREFMAVLPCFAAGDRLRRAFSISAHRQGAGAANSAAAVRSRQRAAAANAVSNGIAGSKYVRRQNQQQRSKRLTVAEPDDFSNIALELHNNRKRMFQKSGLAVAAVAMKYGRMQQQLDQQAQNQEQLPLNNNNNNNNNDTNEEEGTDNIITSNHANGSDKINTDKTPDQDF